MDLNDLQLKPQLIAGLYTNVLVETSASSVPLQTSSPAFLGKNDRQVLILVTNEEHVYLSESELSFLTSILSACQMGLSDVAILNVNRLPVKDLAVIAEQIPHKKVLLFGLEPQEIDLPMLFPAFQVQEFNGVTYLHAPALSVIEKNKEVKMKLWAALKKIFALD